jgi:hypothetical protein
MFANPTGSASAIKSGMMLYTHIPDDIADKDQKWCFQQHQSNHHHLVPFPLHLPLSRPSLDPPLALTTDTIASVFGTGVDNSSATADDDASGASGATTDNDASGSGWDGGSGLNTVDDASGGWIDGATGAGIDGTTGWCLWHNY